MPNFVTNAGEEVYSPSSRPVFRRGRRLDEPTIRRIRDILMCLLSSLGMDSTDIGRISKAGVTDRQVRNRCHKDMPIDFRKNLEDIAAEIISSAQRRVAAAKPVRPRSSKAKPVPRYRQLSLFGDD